MIEINEEEEDAVSIICMRLVLARVSEQHCNAGSIF